MITLSVPTGRRLKSGMWNIELMLAGKKVSITRETAQEAQIEAFILKLSEKYKRNIEGRIVGAPLNLSQATTNYIAKRSNVLSPSTIRGYTVIQHTRFKSVMDKPVNNATDWQEVINDEADLCSPKTLQNAWSLIKSVLEDNGLKVPKVTLPKIIPPEHEILEPDQIDPFIEAIRGHQYELLMLLGLHGLRRSEIYALEKSDVKNGYININKTIVLSLEGWVMRETTKTVNSTRKIPVLIERLNELVEQAPDGLLQKERGDHTSRLVNTVCRKLGFPEVGLHGLRHTFASLCYHLGLPEMQTMELGGWSDINVMRKIYTHLAKEDRKKAANTLKGFFDKK